ncbi:Rieske 2Fe-2S domain-containing protein [Salicibibacter cibarius]|uniref:Rieske 2Fe-2S domain-containing protein n=1 Tax=Salicibibacter cibarius TaxID=2743000 RepID=A0A7T6Z1V4_9BACI|nr:Rieske 2Fe-2S domain-containing protein [Salicibibacter cibarius]QQK74756.1 Rieske 2Fe-2S domain-containing protein [Salicibibacter cibarius]
MTEQNKPYEEDNYTHNIHRNRERTLDRRGFMKTMVGAAGVFAVSSLPWGGVAARELWNFADDEDERQKIANVTDVPVGESFDFTYPTEHDSALLIRLAENDYVAYQNACTHLQCPVFWEKESWEMICPCHHGYFSAETGEPTGGPPRRPLPEIELQVQDGTIYAVKVKRYEA